MIPKTIHYCWFGRGAMPSLALKCIASWKKYMPDYEIKRWDETNFDVNIIPYTKEAYENRKYAFVTDYVRLYALYHEGGIYMDTDVEVLKNLDCFLNLPAFSGFEDDTLVPTGIMGSEKEGEWAKWQLSYYNDKHFILPDGNLDLTTNVKIITDSMAQKGFILKNSFQNFQDMITIYPKDYFCPKSYKDKKIYLTQNTYCIHHFAQSWVSNKKKINRNIAKFIGPKLTKFAVTLKNMFK